MIIPEKLKIGGFEWSVQSHEDVSRESDTFGSTHTATQKIFIEPNIPQQKKEQTLLHEILHAVWWQNGIERTTEDKKLEERVVHSLSMGLYQVLKDNDFLK